MASEQLQDISIVIEEKDSNVETILTLAIERGLFNWSHLKLYDNKDQQFVAETLIF